MKKTVLARSRFTPALAFALVVGSTALAQKTPALKPDSREVNIRIIDRNGDDVRELERTYRTDGMSSADRDKLVTKLVDSLKSTRKDNGNRQMTIIVEDNNGNQAITRQRAAPRINQLPGDAFTQRNRLPNNNFFWNDRNWQYGFRRGADSVADQLRRLKFDFPRDLDRQFVRPFEDWSRNVSGKASTIRGLEAFPNNPDRDQLNVRFTAPAKGDVTITVTNTKGKEVAKREIKDFSGEFVGQIDLGKKAQGIYFLTVTQHEDGAVRRIVVE